MKNGFLKFTFALTFMLLCLPLEAQNVKRDFDVILELRQDRDKFIEAVRAYDKAQLILVKADHMISEQYQNENNDDMAKAKLKKANDRIANIKELYQIALGQYGDSALLHNYYGELLYDQYGNIPGALMEWNKALSYDSKCSQAYNNLGLHQTHSGDYKMGVYNLEMALELEPENPDYLYNLVQIYLIHTPQVAELKGMDNAKIYKQAMKMSKQAALLAPKEYDLVSDYAVNFFASENLGVEADWNEAVAAWQTAREATRTSEEKFYTWLNEARVWIKLNNAQEAKRCLSEALIIRPDSPVAQKLFEEQESTPEIAEPQAPSEN